VNVIVFGAHPDDCELQAGGTAIRFVESGHKVKFVSVTNGDAGHQTEGGGALAKRRRAEAAKADKILGVESVVLDNHDAELLPTLKIREQLIRLIRDWNADIVIAPRPNDYHPDHRYTGVLVQDTAYMVIVPNVCPDTPPLKKNPVYMFLQDRFQSPEPFRPDVIVPIDNVIEQKSCALNVMISQFYEWLPWTSGNLENVPEGNSERRAWLGKNMRRRSTNRYVKETQAMYGHARAKSIGLIEAFQVCEYGRRPSREELRKLFPFLPVFAS
jgi:N-acetylglucosamine malate deacetylase 1